MQEPFFSSYMFCSECCKKLLEILNFQRTCQNAHKSLLENGLPSLYHHEVLRLRGGIKDLILSNVKEEDSLEITDNDKVIVHSLEKQSVILREPTLIQIKTENESKVIEDRFDKETNLKNNSSWRKSCNIRTVSQNNPQVVKQVLEIFCTFCSNSFPKGRPFNSHLIQEHAVKEIDQGYICKICQTKISSKVPSILPTF